MAAASVRFPRPQAPATCSSLLADELWLPAPCPVSRAVLHWQQWPRKVPLSGQSQG